MLTCNSSTSSSIPCFVQPEQLQLNALQVQLHSLAVLQVFEHELKAPAHEQLPKGTNKELLYSGNGGNVGVFVENDFK